MIRNNALGVASIATAAALLIGGLTTPAPAQDTITLTLWSRADNSGPLRPGNILKGADALNEVLAAEGADYRVAIEVLEQPSEGGYDGDAERLLRAYAIGEGPDLFHAAHEWVCAFADNGYLFDLTDYTENNPDLFGDVFPSLWASTECGGRRFAVPQDAEARMFFFSKTLMREAGFDDEFIESLDERVLAGEVTMDGIADIAKQVVDNTDAEYGIFHRPSRGPDYIMPFFQYGNSFVDAESGKLLLEFDKLAAAYGWFARNVEIGRNAVQQHVAGMGLHPRPVLCGEQRGHVDVRDLGSRFKRVSARRSLGPGCILRAVRLDRGTCCGGRRTAREPDAPDRLRRLRR